MGQGKKVEVYFHVPGEVRQLWKAPRGTSRAGCAGLVLTRANQSTDRGCRSQGSCCGVERKVLL